MVRKLQFAAALLVLPALGCSAEIGDECVTGLDCSSYGDRLCDTSQPGGYCTVFNCEADSCPEEGACVMFYGQLDPACGPLDDSRYPRFARTFCMRECEDDDDCRSGYECVLPVERQAVMIDTDADDFEEADAPEDVKVCLAIGTYPAAPSETPGVCSPPDGGTDLEPYVPDAGAGGMAGAGGTGGMAGGGGTGGMAGGGGTAGAGGVGGGTAGAGGIGGGTAGAGGIGGGTAGAGGIGGGTAGAGGVGGGTAGAGG